MHLSKRIRRPAPSRPGRKEEPKPAWGSESHSGEGSASALETLRKLEQSRKANRPADPRDDHKP